MVFPIHETPRHVLVKASQAIQLFMQQTKHIQRKSIQNSKRYVRHLNEKVSIFLLEAQKIQDKKKE